MHSAPPLILRWLLLFGVWLLYGAFGLVATSLAPLVMLIERDLNLSHSAMGSILGAWQLVYIFSAIPCGILLDRLGARWALTLGALLIAASVLLRSLADGYLGLLAAVMIFGLGGPIISVGAPKVVAQWFTGRDRGLAMGIYITGPAIGGIVSLTMTHSVLLPAFDQDWRRVLMLWSAVALLGGMVWFAVASRPGAQRPGGDLSRAPKLPQSQVITTLLRKPAVRLVLWMSVGTFLFNHALNNWLPELLRSGGMTIIEAGYWAALPTVVGIAGSLLIPRLATPERRFHILMGLCVAAAIASILLQLQQDSVLFTGLMLQGIAQSSMMTVLILTLVELPDIGDRHAGTASGLFFSAAEVGGVLGPLSFGAMYDLTGGFDTGLYALTAVATALGLGVIRLQRLARSTSE